MTKEDIMKQYEKRKNTNQQLYYYQVIDTLDDMEKNFTGALYFYKELNVWHVYFEQKNKEFLDQFGYYIIGINDLSLEKQIINELHKKRYFISCAESCTGGSIISRLIGISGASYVINESYVTYSSEAKNRILGVKKETISKYTVTSIEVAEEMVKGLRKISNSNICISVTGFAGGGESKEPTDGLCFFGILHNDGKKEYIHLEKVQVDGNRNECRLAQGTYILWRTLMILRNQLL